MDFRVRKLLNHQLVLWVWDFLWMSGSMSAIPDNPAAFWGNFSMIQLFPNLLVLNVGNGWEWMGMGVAGMIIDSYCGFIPFWPIPPANRWVPHVALSEGRHLGMARGPRYTLAT